MKNLSITISNDEFEKFGFKKETLAFSEVLEMKLKHNRHNPIPDPFRQLAERACPENRESGGEVEIKLKSQNTIK